MVYCRTPSKSNSSRRITNQFQPEYEFEKMKTSKTPSRPTRHETFFRWSTKLNSFVKSFTQTKHFSGEAWKNIFRLITKFSGRITERQWFSCTRSMFRVQEKVSFLENIFFYSGYSRINFHAVFQVDLVADRNFQVHEWQIVRYTNK